jgi:hypothetical protein
VWLLSPCCEGSEHVQKPWEERWQETETKEEMYADKEAILGWITNLRHSQMVLPKSETNYQMSSSQISEQKCPKWQGQLLWSNRFFSTYYKTMLFYYCLNHLYLKFVVSRWAKCRDEECFLVFGGLRFFILLFGKWSALKVKMTVLRCIS